MRLRGFAPSGAPTLSYLRSPQGSIVGGVPGPSPDDVQIVGDGVQFYVNGKPIGSPLPLTVVDLSAVDGGTPASTGTLTLDGGAP